MKNQNMTGMVDAAMSEMVGIHPPLTRSDCERLIRAALDANAVALVGQVQIPTDTMEQEFQTHYRRGYAAAEQVHAVMIADCRRQAEKQVNALTAQRDMLLAVAKQVYPWIVDQMLENGHPRERVYSPPSGSHLFNLTAAIEKCEPPQEIPVGPTPSP